MSLRIQLLGPLRVWKDQDEITEAIRHIGKADTLLKVFVSHPARIFTQEQLIELLWGEEIAADKTTEAKAAGNLRRRLSELRKLLEPASSLKNAARGYILTTPDGYCWNPQADCHIDIDEFSGLCQRAQALQNQKNFNQAISIYEAALGLCRGDLLEEDRDAFWADLLRAKYKEDRLQLLENLAECHARLGQYRRAIALCREILQSEELRESAYGRLMVFQYLAGERAEALRTFDECESVLRAQLNVEPAPQAKELFHQIRDGRLPELEKLYPPIKAVPPEIPHALSPGSVPFAGRRAESAHLLDLLKRARQGHGQCALINGEAGVGKTRLVQELIARAGRRYKTLDVRQGRSREPGEPSVWAELVRQCLAKFSDAQLREIPPLWLAEVAKLVKELRERMPELPENPPLPPPQEQLRFFEGLTRFFLEWGSAGSTPASPLQIFFLDDLHWAAATDLEFLRYFLPRIAAAPILIVGAYRAEEVTEVHPLFELVREWEEKKLVQHISLARLTAAETQEFLRGLPLKIEQPGIFYGKLFQETEGNPFFLIATLQEFFERGILRVRGKSWAIETEKLSTAEFLTPKRVEELIARRVQRLSEHERKLLTLAGVIGRDVELSLLMGAWEGEEAALTAALMGLCKKQLLLARGERRYEFSHDKIREIVYARLERDSPAFLQLLHQRVLQALERLYGARLEEWAALLARQAQRAGQWKKALEYALQGLKRSVTEYRWREGLELGELGLEAVQRLTEAGEDRAWLDEQAFELWSGRLMIYDIQGQRKEQEDSLGHLQQLAERLGQKVKQASVCQRRARFYEKVGRYAEAEAEALRAIALSQESGDQEGHLDGLMELVAVYGSLGRYDDALRRSQEIFKLSQRMGDRRLQARALHNRGNVYWWMGQHERAMPCYREALEIRRTIADRRAQGTSLTNIGLVLLSQGQYGDALGYFRESLEICRELGDRQGQADILNYLGAIAYYQGEYDEAGRHYHEALQIREEISDRRGQADNFNNLGLICHNRGQYGEAERYYQRAREIYEEIGNERGRAQNLGNLGGLYRERGRRAEALNYYRMARSVFEAMGNKDGLLMCFSAEGILHQELGQSSEALAQSAQAVGLLEAGQVCELPQDVYFNHYQILSAQGRSVEALSYLEKAHAELIQRADQIKDPKLRESFLTHVKTNREIVEEHQRHFGARRSPENTENDRS